MSIDSQACEEIFEKTTTRLKNGQFCVDIPLKESEANLGESFQLAKGRFLNIERKLNKNPALKQQYSDFIKEYETLGHLTEIEKPSVANYLPHHAVLREHSETTKLRVVFDASAKTTSGKSFNDIQYIGPVIQDDLFSIILRFRQHRFVFSADIEKMYRCIQVNPDQRHLQIILWRDKVEGPLRYLQLNTVTYGTASAPFLATRCLQQLAKECKNADTATIIEHDFYVDDVLTGAQTTQQLKNIYHSITNQLNSASFPLRKFRTNTPSTFDNNENTEDSKNLQLSSETNTLGFKWHPLTDSLLFPVKVESDSQLHSTKRMILSIPAKIYDTLGLLSLSTIIPKIILQKLWLTKFDWDDPVPHDISKQWNKFMSGLQYLSTIKIPRYALTNEPVTIQLHTFSDASQNAYGACVYLRTVDSLGECAIHLLWAKTKVASLKPVTIPRLELNGALLAARLCNKVSKSLRIIIDLYYHWTDSSVVLGWISSDPCNHKTYLANRVREIQELTSMCNWRHIPGNENPADLASRGVDPQRVQSEHLWWHGPSFLLNNSSSWPSLNTIKSLLVPETKERKTNYINDFIDFNPFSKFVRLQRTTAYALRFIYNVKNPKCKLTGNISVSELNGSLQVLTKQAQLESFFSEIKMLKLKGTLPSKSSILSLTPFLDESGVLRVGGRIQQSSLDWNQKHPAVLHHKHHLTKLLFAHEHIRLLHCGLQLLLHSIRDRFWSTRGRIIARSTTTNCVRCRRFNAKAITPIMGDLPVERVTPNYPFQICGTDFAGPFYITDRKGRGCRISKCYLCIFVCFSTKAVHLEVASDLSKDIFIQCLKRFISRRGLPYKVFCDNGLNFVGASNEIAQFLKNNSDDLVKCADGEGIHFVFSPPYAPNFGGLWEAGVKAAKFHAKRILGDTHLTYEELSTLFANIESILNSRPLTALTSDPNDLQPLTPGHFLIGRSMTSLPSPNLMEFNPSKLNRFQRIEQYKQHFWDRWKNEYLKELQQRHKWKKSGVQPKVGQLVILHDQNLPPLKWRLGRIHRIYQGPDGASRVADIMTTKGVICRTMNKLSPLLPSTEDNNLESRELSGSHPASSPGRMSTPH